MPRKKVWLSERALLRSIEKFNKRASVGVAVIAEASKTKQEAVTKVAIKIGRSERYVWGTVKLGSKSYAAILAKLEKLTSRNKRRRPRSVASLFLLNELRYEPRSMKEIEALARKSGIAVSTLRRAGKELGVRKRHVGGRRGHWTWELPVEVKINFRVEV